MDDKKIISLTDRLGITDDQLKILEDLNLEDSDNRTFPYHRYYSQKRRFCSFASIERCCQSELKGIFINYKKNPDLYVHKFKTTVNGKTRQIVTYRSTPEGQALRQLHRMFSFALEDKYTYHPKSFAYQQKKSINICLQEHLRSDTFLKSDIHAYFDTVTFDRMVEQLHGIRVWGKTLFQFVKRILRTCFYEGHLPIGFITSPILSDIYLHDLDQKMGKIRGINYTRYADDFIISASGAKAKEKLEKTLERLQKEISNHQLELNKKKTYIRQLRLEGDAIHLLGLNMVRNAKMPNRITVSNSFLVETSKEFAYLLHNKHQLEPWELRRCFVSMMGRISFIRSSSPESTEKFRKLLLVKTGIETDLAFRHLSALLLKDVSLLRDYEDEKRAEAYARVYQGKKDFPNAARVWENLILEGDPRSVRRNSLAYHLFTFCKAYEPESTGRIRVNYLHLEIGDELFRFEETWDPKVLREKIHQIQQSDAKIIRYSVDYVYNNNIPCERRVKRHYPHYLIAGTSIIYNEQENEWLFAQKTGNVVEDFFAQKIKKTDSDILNTQPAWEGNLLLSFRWPLTVEKETQDQINKGVKELEKLLEDENFQRENETRSLIGKINGTMEAKKLSDLTGRLQDLAFLIRQTGGEVSLKGWYIPKGFLKATKETSFTYVQFSSVEGKIILKTFEG